MTNKLYDGDDDPREILLHLKNGNNHFVIRDHWGDGQVEICTWSYSSGKGQWSLEGCYVLDAKESLAVIRTLMGIKQ